MTGKTKTLLVVAGEFPPLKTIGRIRTVKFVDHLRAHGWRSVVVAVAPTGREPNFDPALSREIPGDTEVVRVPLVDYEERIALAVKRMLGRGGTATPAAVAASAGPSKTVSTGGGTPPGGALDRAHDLVRHALKHYVYVPDNYRGWARLAQRECERICATRHIDAIYTTLPPFSSALVGYNLRRSTGLPWIVDYRDLWYGDVLREWLPTWRTRLELGMERRLLRRADVIVTVSEPKTAFMQKLHPGLNARWDTFTNGFDVETYRDLARTRPFDPGVIEFVYTGRLFKNRRGYAFAEALGRIARRDRNLAAPVRVRIVGGVSPEIRTRYDEILREYDIAEHFRFEGDVNQSAALDAQVNCDYLLLIVDTGETSDGVIPGKLFEYIAARRPIFALCDPGVTQQILERSRAGVVIPAEDVDGVERALLAVLRTPVPQSVQLDEDYLAQFDRKAIAARFAGLLDELAARPPAR